MNEVRVMPKSAETIYVDTQEHSYGIFCFNEIGDLFLNSDWGLYGFAWRSMGKDTTKEFIASCNADYISGKFRINISSEKDRKDYDKYRAVHVVELIKHLIAYCKEGTTKQP